MFKISEGVIETPVLMVLYGPEGIGKSSLAAVAPNPLMLDLEGGTLHINVRRIAGISTFSELLNTLSQVDELKAECETLVIDTLDKAEELCISEMCAKDNKRSIEDYGYGQGYTRLAERFSELLKKVSALKDAGLNIILIAHSTTRKFESPDSSTSYDRYELKLTKRVTPMVKEACDALLFANFETFVTEGPNGKGKAHGGTSRVLFTQHTAIYDAKNRFRLAPKLPMSFNEIESCFVAKAGTAAPVKAEVPATMQHLKDLAALLKKDNVSEAEFKEFMKSAGKYETTTSITNYADADVMEILSSWDSIVKAIRNN